MFSRYGVFPMSVEDKIAALPYYQRYTQMGNYLTVDSDSEELILGAGVVEGYSVAALFDEEIVAAAGAHAGDYVEENDYAVVVIGTNPYPGACEFSDRVNLDFGRGQLEMAHKMASEFPGKTVIVVLSNYPLAMEELHNDENIAAILYSSFAGQYDSYVLAQMLYGDCVPSGRLTVTWLKDLSSLPKLTQEQRKEEDVDPRFTVYMKNADQQQLGLTYLHNNPEDATYHFGYGLSYTTFEYSDIQIIPQVTAADNITVEITVTNTGSFAGKERSK